MVLKNLFESMFYNTTNSAYLRTVASVFAAVSELRTFLPKARNLKPTAIVAVNSRQSICRMDFAGERAELFHRLYKVLDGLADASKLATKLLNVLERSESFLLNPLQTLFYLVMLTFPGAEALKEEVNWKL